MRFREAPAGSPVGASRSGASPRRGYFELAS